MRLWLLLYAVSLSLYLFAFNSISIQLVSTPRSQGVSLRVRNEGAGGSM
jgi:hypothetical protein